ncbi:hypothetical protein ACWGJ6_23365 [Streptomyces canus]
MTAPADCDPTWSDIPADHMPTPFTLRQDEMRDLHAQGAGSLALWTAETVTPPREYL